MAKVLLVEDDNNLREIYEARLQAEGYEIASAQDGEQALVVAKQFKPELVISDVMMPKISGFEMLDILRNTEGLEHTRVIMLTALGQAEDKTRADSLGADRYLVKSQVTLEDIVKSAHEILDGETAAPAPEATAAAPEVSPTAVAMAEAPAEAPAEPAVEAEAPAEAEPLTVTEAPAVATPPAVDEPSVAEPAAPANETPAVAPEPTTDAPAEEAEVPTAPMVSEPTPAVDNEIPTPPSTDNLVAPTEASPAVTESAPATTTATEPTSSVPSGSTTESEQATVNQQIENFINSADPSPAPQAPATAASDDTTAAQDTPTTSGTDAQATSATDADDQLLAEAADSLADGTETVTSTEPSATVTPEANAAPTVPSVAETIAADNGVSIPGKKVIQPPESVAKPDLNELLAREEAAQDGMSASPSAMPAHQPGEAFTPEQAETPAPATEPQKPADFNPHDIAL